MIQIDLRRDLPKAALKNLGTLGSCRYSAPCAIGAMMTPEQRESLTSDDDVSIDHLLRDSPQLVEAPHDQWYDLALLQGVFDEGDPEAYAEAHAQLVEKYECSEVSSSTSPQ